MFQHGPAFTVPYPLLAPGICTLRIGSRDGVNIDIAVIVTPEDDVKGDIKTLDLSDDQT